MYVFILRKKRCISSFFFLKSIDKNIDNGIGFKLTWLYLLLKLFIKKRDIYRVFDFHFAELSQSREQDIHS